jgi:hypothetical protein
MVPQQTHYQISWSKVFEHAWACPFAICYLLFAIPVALPIAQNFIDDPGVPGADGVSL